jgi:hypothetical protein
MNQTRNRKKENLPTKICATCNRPFTWRKKWAKCWEMVRYCSERCRGNRSAGGERQGSGD